MTSKQLAKRGPKTAPGKLAVSTNASTHGILSPRPVVVSYESQATWRTYRQSILDSLSPEGGMEQALAERVALCSWRLNRVVFYETERISELQESVVDEMRRNAERFPTLHADEATDLKAVEQVGLKRAIYEDVLTTLRESAQELRSHHSASWIYEHAPWFALELVGYQNDPRHYDPDEDEDERIEASEVLEDKLRERLNDSLLPTVADLREALEWLAGEVGLEDSIGADGEVCYTPVEGLLEKLATVAEGEMNRAQKRAQEAEKKILGKRRERILPGEQDLQKISRYEAHLSKQMYQALHELEALQTRRAGGVAPLARIDVHGDEPPEP
jgi:hypothetical protein